MRGALGTSCTAFLLLVFQVFHLTRARSTMNPLFKSSVFVLKGHNLSWTSYVVSNMHNSFQGLFISFKMSCQKCKEQAQLLHYLRYVGFKHWAGEAAVFLMERHPMLWGNTDVMAHLGTLPSVFNTSFTDTTVPSYTQNCLVWQDSFLKKIKRGSFHSVSLILSILI